MANWQAPHNLNWPAGALLAAGALYLSWSVFSCGSSTFIPVTCTLPAASQIALTFDDGPHENFTPRVLDILDRLHVPASFFLIGQCVRRNPEIVQRMAQAGHTIGNHTWDHNRFGITHGTAYWYDQLFRTGQVIFDATGGTPMLFRPPFGFKTWHMARAVRRLNLNVVAWRLRVFDTRPLSPQRIARSLVRRTRGGDILTLHDGLEPARAGLSQDSTVKALPDVINGLKQRGFTFVSLSQGLRLTAAALDKAAVN